jgi:hypothetical protein
MEPLSAALIGASLLLTMCLASLVGLKGWQAWLDYKRLELASQAGDHGLPPAGGRIELADLKERVRKLEAIAAGIDI